MDPSSAIMLITAVAGAAMQAKSTQDAADDRRKILNRQLDRNDEASKKAVDMVTQEGQKYSGEKRLNDMAANEEQANTQEQADLKAGAGGNAVGSFGTSGDAGAVSEDFIKGKADRAVTEGNRLTSLAREIAKTRAPGMMQVNEANRRANLSSDLQNIFGSNQNMANATANDASAVYAKTGPGAIVSAIGAGMAAGGLGASKPALGSGISGGLGSASSASPFGGYGGGVRF